MVWHLRFPVVVQTKERHWLPLNNMIRAITSATELRSLDIFVHPAQIKCTKSLFRRAPRLVIRKAPASIGDQPAAEATVDQGDTEGPSGMLSGSWRAAECHSAGLGEKPKPGGLIHSLRSSAALKHLELVLRGNHLGRGFGAIIGSLSLCTTLETLMLDLTDCGVRDHIRSTAPNGSGVAAADAIDVALLSQAPQLKTLRLWLTGNCIRDDAGVMLLRRLEVGMPRIKDAYIDPIAAETDAISQRPDQ